MSKKKSILILFLLCSLGLTISCNLSGDSETEKLRKEVEEMKKEKTEKEIAELKEKVKDQEEAEKDKKEEKKPAATPKPKKKVPAPVGSTVAKSNTGNVVVRDSPSLQGKKVTGLKNGEKVYVIGESANTDDWKGTQYPWKNIQKEDGTKGWVLGAFIDE